MKVEGGAHPCRRGRGGVKRIRTKTKQGKGGRRMNLQREESGRGKPPQSWREGE